MTKTEITEWEKYLSKPGSSLKGYFGLALPSGMVIHHLMLFENKEGERWVGFPARQTKEKNGQGRPVYSPIVEFTSHDKKKDFERLALDAIDRYFGEAGK